MTITNTLVCLSLQLSVSGTLVCIFTRWWICDNEHLFIISNPLECSMPWLNLPGTLRFAIMVIIPHCMLTTEASFLTSHSQHHVAHTKRWSLLEKTTVHQSSQTSPTTCTLLACNCLHSPLLLEVPSWSCHIVHHHLLGVAMHAQQCCHLRCSWPLQCHLKIRWQLTCHMFIGWTGKVRALCPGKHSQCSPAPPKRQSCILWSAER